MGAMGGGGGVVKGAAFRVADRDKVSEEEEQGGNQDGADKFLLHLKGHFRQEGGSQ